MPNERRESEPATPDDAQPAGQGDDDDDVEGHVFMRAIEPSGPDGGDDDVEGHALFRSQASRGE